MRRLGILFILVFACFSCQDFLNLVPKNQQVIYTQEDVKTAMSSFILTCGTGNKYIISYNGTRLRFPLMKDVTTTFTIYGDDIDLTRYLDSRYTGTPYTAIYTECVDWKAVDMAERMWGYFYSSIGFLNEMMKNLDNAPAGDADEYQRIAGEARVFRAFYAFKLMQYFAPYHDNNLGIPLNLDADVVEGGARLKQTEVYNTIIRELHDVLEYTAQPLVDWNVMYDKEIIKAMLAQVYHYKAMSAAAEASDWSNAEKYSGELMEKHRLETEAADLTAQFIPSKVVGWRKDSPYSLLMLVCYNYNKQPELAPWGGEDERQYPNPDLVSMYDANDIRLTTYLGYQYMQGLEQWYVGKYDFEVNSNYNTYDESLALFRIADMYLINAEAKARMGQEGPAKQILLTFKQSRIPGFTTVAGNVLDEILKERRKEFCYEGDARFMDIKRLGLSIDRSGVDPKGDGTKEYRLDKNDYRYTLPIPAEAELGYNKIEQNPGWNIVK